MKVCDKCGALREVAPLLPSQAEVMWLLAKGYSHGDICKKLRLGRTALSARLTRAAARIGCSTTWQAMRKLTERGYFKE